MIKLNAKQLRTSKRNPREEKKLKKNPIYIILDNVLDTYNIGSIFRLADAIAAQEIILCGETQVPPHARIKKASINTTEWVGWRYFPSAKEAISKLKTERAKLKVVCLEQAAKSVSYTKMRVEFPMALVVGNESRGVSREVLKIADEIVEIPMWGVNKSLNVMVSLAIVLYKISENLD